MSHLVGDTPFDFETDHRYSPVYRRSIAQRTLFIPGGGCKYWLKSQGKGCTFCGFPGLTRFVVLGPGQEGRFEHWCLDDATYAAMFDAASADPAGVDKFAIFNGGSFFVDNEVPPKARRHMLTGLAGIDPVSQVMVESRPEYLDAATLTEARAMLDGKDLMIGLGLESVDARVRNGRLRKGMRLADFEVAVALMQRHGVQVFVYAFLKAPGQTEGEAVADCIATLDYLQALGVDEIALSCAFVPPFTPLETLYRSGGFRPPWLWSVQFVSAYAHDHGIPLSIGGFDDKPQPVAAPANCDACTDRALAGIDMARRTGDISFAVTCACRDTWQAEMRQHRETRHQG